MFRLSWLVVFCLLMLGLVACPDPQPPITPAGLTVDVEGLPDDVDANVRVHGPDGYREHLAESTTLTGLAPGDYTVVPFSTANGDDTFVTITDSRSVVIDTTSRERITITYELVPVVIPDDSKPIDAETADALIGFTPQGVNTLSNPDDPAFYEQPGGTLVFARTSDYLDGLEVGDVMQVGVTPATPFGIIGRVASITPSSDQVTVELDPATIEDAVSEGAAILETSLTSGNVLSAQALMPGVEPLAVDPSLTDEICISLTRSFSSAGASVAATSGSICLEQRLIFSLHRTWSGIDLEFGVEVTNTVNLGIDVTSTLADYKDSVQLARYVFTPITVFIGPVPVVFTPEVVVGINVQGEIVAGIEAGVQKSITFKRGFKYTGGDWSSIEPSATRETEKTPLTPRLGANARVSAGPAVRLMLYGVLGPSAGINGYLEFEAELGDADTWSLNAGLEVEAGAQFTVLSIFEVSRTLHFSIFETVLADGAFTDVEVSISPDEVTLEPGGTQEFTATVTGADDTGVTWEASCGSIAGASKTVTYTAPTGFAGECEVTATSVEDPHASATATVQVSVQVAPPTISNFMASPSPANVGEVVAFTWEVDGGDPPVACELDVNDTGSADYVFETCANQSSLQQHTYDDPGTYVAVVTATDAGGRSVQESLSVVVESDPDEPVVGLDPTTVATGFRHSLALKDDGTVWAWGDNSQYRLGDGTFVIYRETPVQVRDLSGGVEVGAGGAHSLALRDDGTVWAWGYNNHGQLGDGATTDRHTPVQVRDLSGVVSISSGGWHSLALRDDGTVWAWGWNEFGQLGDGTTTDRYSPVQVQNLSGVVSVAGGGGHSLALRDDGTLWAWGWNEHGQLGDGATTDRHTPVQVRDLSGVVSIASGVAGGHSLALRDDGTVWAWGNNWEGQIGDGTTTDRHTPVQVRDLSGVVSIASGSGHSLAIRDDGALWARGWNEHGQLGDGTTTSRHMPVQVRDLSGVVSISGGEEYSLALKHDGTVRAWGSNRRGQLGDGTTTDRHTPAQTDISGVRVP